MTLIENNRGQSNINNHYYHYTVTINNNLSVE